MSSNCFSRRKLASGFVQVCAGITLLALAASPVQANLVINAGYDASWATNPNSALATAVVNRVIGEFQNDFSNNVTMKIQFGWGEVGGQSVGAGGGAELEPNDPSIGTLP
jgi:hypothetical protein